MSTEVNNLVSLNISSIYGTLKLYQKDFEKLASGSRLNRASDGAAEIAITNLLKADLVSIDQGIRNIRDGVSMLHIADGSLEIVSRNLIRMKELAAQASSDVYSPEQKKLIQQEFDQLASQNVQIGEMTNFNGIRLHKDNQTISITAEGQEVAAIQTKSVPLPTADLSDSETTVSILDKIIEFINSYRSSLGSHVNTLEKSAASLQIKAEEILESESRIADIDTASAASSLTANKILTDQAIAAQSHSKTVSQVTSILL